MKPSLVGGHFALSTAIQHWWGFLHQRFKMSSYICSFLINEIISSPILEIKARNYIFKPQIFVKRV